MIFNAIFDVLIVVVLINSKDIFDVLISTFWSTKKTISTFWSSTEFSEFFMVFDVLIFVVLTFSQKREETAGTAVWFSTVQNLGADCSNFSNSFNLSKRPQRVRKWQCFKLQRLEVVFFCLEFFRKNKYNLSRLNDASSYL